MEKAITANSCAFLVEPIQGEAGIRIPQIGYLKKAAEICKKNNILFIADEIQSGLGRTGKLLACDHEDVKPDGLILGKALGGGMLPVSMFLARHDIMDVFTPGDHGSTFGGNALSSAVGLEALKIIEDESLCAKSAQLGAYMLEKLDHIKSPAILDLRGRGLFIGLEINPQFAKARDICLASHDKGLLSKDTHGTVVRLAPPLVITQKQIDWAVATIADVLANWHRYNAKSVSNCH